METTFHGIGQSAPVSQSSQLRVQLRKPKLSNAVFCHSIDPFRLEKALLVSRQSSACLSVLIERPLQLAVSDGRFDQQQGLHELHILFLQVAKFAETVRVTHCGTTGVCPNMLCRAGYRRAFVMRLGFAVGWRQAPLIQP